MTESFSLRATRRILGTLLAITTAFALSLGVAQVDPAPTPTQPVQPTDPAQPVQPTDPAQPVQPTDPQPVQPTDPTQPVQPDPLAPVDEEEDAVQPDMPIAPQLPVQPGIGTLPEGVDPMEPVIQLGEDETVTQLQFAGEFDRAMRSLAMQHGFPYTEETRQLFERFRGEFLEMYATQQALLREARDRGIEITDEEIDEQVDLARGDVDDMAFAQNLRDLGYLNVEDYRLSIHDALMAQRVADEFRGEIMVSDEELREYHETHRARFFQDREFDEARDDVEQRLIGERLNEQFRTLRQDRGIEVFSDRLAWSLNQN
jgi:hypothetical protein